MKKQYMTPATEWVMIDKVVILAGSGPTAGGQSDPTIGSRDDEDLFSPEQQLWGDNQLFNMIK